MIKTRADWYSQNYILQLLVNQLRYKHISIRKVVDGKGVLARYYMGYSLELLKGTLLRSNAYKDTSVKLYFDLSYWKNQDGKTPLFSYNTKIRTEQKELFNQDYGNYWLGYDFALDIDSEDINKAWEDAKKIKELLDEYKLPYSVKFSGSKGFHFLIQDKWFGNEISPKEKVELANSMAHIVCSIAGVKGINEGGTFDDTIYDDRRIFKLAYSLNYKNGKEYVCLPLSDSQFENFKLIDMEMLNVVNNNKLLNRGLLERTHGLTEKELIENVKKFIGEIIC